MIKQIYSIYDKKASFYLTPFVMHNDEEAVRALVTTMASAPELPLATNPEDYQLAKIGNFDDSTSEIEYGPVTIIAEVNALVGGTQEAT